MIDGLISKTTVFVLLTDILLMDKKKSSMNEYPDSIFLRKTSICYTRIVLVAHYLRLDQQKVKSIHRLVEKRATVVHVHRPFNYGARSPIYPDIER